ncbi:helix-turn-helix domain-containing protein [Aliivibrio fischeri]|uniref:helix-turn-helix domain-containing protein n=1 Tax=Aliivibrio fischeri TaxID=668 RepID=UPI0012D92449|nr:helix-turn-helix transcriptional regulator [Aliivibrio fischeri]MUK60697.1 helix-turn-helix domain-containing protein [Aliivibrio fischeri]MUL20797.1 helix-turn-helix domain-containing protein [Aliivibrio fischeri]MUL24572.1 helix-turn-helix domain-containing protein [Aliivibrio fischeri]
MTKANIVGAQIRAIRKEKKLTQEQLTARCNLEGFDISRGTLAKIEAGIRQVIDIEVVLISKALNINIDKLFNVKG